MDVAFCFMLFKSIYCNQSYKLTAIHLQNPVMRRHKDNDGPINYWIRVIKSVKWLKGETLRRAEKEGSLFQLWQGDSKRNVTVAVDVRKDHRRKKHCMSAHTTMWGEKEQKHQWDVNYYRKREQLSLSLDRSVQTFFPRATEKYTKDLTPH